MDDPLEACVIDGPAIDAAVGGAINGSERVPVGTDAAEAPRRRPQRRHMQVVQQVRRGAAGVPRRGRAGGRVEP